MPAKIRRQRPVKGGRHALPSCVLKEIAAHIEREASRYHVSRSFVIATILGHALHVAEQEDYRGARLLRRVK